MLDSPAETVTLSVGEAGVNPVAAARIEFGATGAGAGSAEPLRVVANGTTVFLDASRSTSASAALRSGLLYRWTQLEGPRVESAQTSGGENTPQLRSVLQFTPRVAGLAVFECELSELTTAGTPTGIVVRRRLAVAADSPVAVVPEVFTRLASPGGGFGSLPSAGTPRQVDIALSPGLNILGIPVSVTGIDHALDVSDIATLTGSPFVAYPSTVAGPGWRVYLPDQGMAAPAVVGNGAYLIAVPGNVPRNLRLTGTRWSLDLAKQFLTRRGIGLVAIPGPPGVGKTTDDLLNALGAAYLTAAIAGSDGRGRFLLVFHSTAGSTPQPLREGYGFLYNSLGSGSRNLEGLLKRD